METENQGVVVRRMGILTNTMITAIIVARTYRKASSQILSEQQLAWVLRARMNFTKTPHANRRSRLQYVSSRKAKAPSPQHREDNG
jgi:hypothetical protein